MSELIVVDRHGGWAEIRINRADKHNAMNRAARRGLLNVFDALRDVRRHHHHRHRRQFCVGNKIGVRP